LDRGAVIRCWSPSSHHLESQNQQNRNPSRFRQALNRSRWRNLSAEPKWQSNLTGIGDLHAFHGKIEQKAAWARGLFVSYSGFSQDGLVAFGRGKRTVCMEGLDIHDALQRQILIDHVIEQKVRRAAETGNCLILV